MKRTKKKKETGRDNRTKSHSRKGDTLFLHIGGNDVSTLMQKETEGQTDIQRLSDRQRKADRQRDKRRIHICIQNSNINQNRTGGKYNDKKKRKTKGKYPLLDLRSFGFVPTER